MQVAIPYTGAPLPGARDLNMAVGMVLIDPVTGNPVTPAGTVAGGSGSLPAGLSTNGTIGTTAAIIATAGQFPHSMTVQNTHATNTLHLAFSEAATLTDFTVAPGASITFGTGFSNGLSAIGSAAATTYAIIGW